MFIPGRVAERAVSSYAVDPNGCHISTYSIGSHGYAQVGWHAGDGVRQTTTAHRAAWVSANGQIPVGMTVDHTCKTRRCVNPSHLRLLTNYDNARRTFGRDWPIGQCAKGHPDSDLRRERSGRLRCGTCVAEIEQRTQQRRKRAVLT